MNVNVILAAIFGASAAVIGTLISVRYEGGLPTGPTIVVIGTLVAILAIFLAPKRGLIAAKLMQQKHRDDIKRYRILLHLYTNDSIDEAIPEHLYEEQLILKDEDRYRLTDAGHKKVKAILGGEDSWI